MDQNKPPCKLIGEDGNIFNLLAIAGRTLKDHGLREEAAEMCSRVYESKSYEEALTVIREYVDVM